MKKIGFLLIITGFMLSCGSKKTTSNPEKYAKTITQNELKEMLYIYASDEFEGRETGTKGQKMAVEYLKNEYQKLGIPSPLGNNDYYQEVYLEKPKVAEAQLSINGKTFDAFKNHIVYRTAKSYNVNASEIVYVGYGIDDDTYSDYKNKDVKGKIVLAKAGEPKDAKGNYVTSRKSENTKWTNGRQALSSKQNAAINNGAKGFIYIDENTLNSYAPYYERMAKNNEFGRLTIKGSDESMFMLIANNNVGRALNPSILDNNESKTLKTNLNIEIENSSESVASENVVAYIKGSEKPDEIIVISAHLDHIGVHDGQINNGADDDGSGTIAILEIAEAFKKAEQEGHVPKRSILFLHVTGEEKGLLGSQFYTDNDPIFPLKNTVANLNIDMIGRTDPKRKSGDRNYIYLIGSDKLSTDLHNVSEAVNKQFCNLELDYTYNDDNDPNRFYYRSDHYNFAKHNVPVIFYFNGTHNDYHRPTDTVEKIEYDLLENRTRLIFYTAWEIANRAERLVVDKAE